MASHGWLSKHELVYSSKCRSESVHLANLTHFTLCLLWSEKGLYAHFIYYSLKVGWFMTWQREHYLAWLISQRCWAGLASRYYYHRWWYFVVVWSWWYHVTLFTSLNLITVVAGNATITCFTSCCHSRAWNNVSRYFKRRTQRRISRNMTVLILPYLNSYWSHSPRIITEPIWEINFYPIFPFHLHIFPHVCRTIHDLQITWNTCIKFAHTYITLLLFWHSRNQYSFHKPLNQVDSNHELFERLTYKSTGLLNSNTFDYFVPNHDGIVQWPL